MSDQPPQIADRLREEVYELADSLLRGTITDDEARRLKQLARQSAEARRHYARFMYDSVKLCQWGSDIAAAADERGDECRAIDGQEANVRPNAADGETPAALAAPGAAHSSFVLFPPSFAFRRGSVFLRGRCVAPRHRCRCRPELRAEENSQVATAVTIPTAAPLPSQKVGAKAERVCAGTVTGANNCVWRGSSTLASCAAAAKFELVSGVLEITYGTGVKVSIRGPAYYVVRSADIGYLGLGTLTVRLDEVPDAQRGAGEGRRQPAVADRQVAVSRTCRQQRGSSPFRRLTLTYAAAGVRCSTCWLPRRRSATRRSTEEASGWSRSTMRRKSFCRTVPGPVGPVGAEHQGRADTGCRQGWQRRATRLVHRRDASKMAGFLLKRGDSRQDTTTGQEGISLAQQRSRVRPEDRGSRGGPAEGGNRMNGL